MQDTVAAIHDIAFARNEHILTLRKENLSRFTRFVGETEKLEKDGRRWRRRRRCVGFGRDGVRRCLRPRNFLCLLNAYVPSRARILCVFTSLQQIELQRWVERRSRDAGSLAAGRAAPTCWSRLRD